MSFILSLAHFCDFHGPTSILCTQVLPPDCPACDLSASSNNNPAGPAFDPAPILNPSFTHAKPAEAARHGPRASHAAATPRASVGPIGHPHLPTPSSSLSSPMDTPPQSPRSPSLVSSSLPSSSPASVPGLSMHPTATSAGASSSSDPCKNCCLSLPKSIGDRIKDAGDGCLESQKASDKTVRPPPPMLRTKEVVPIYESSGHFAPPEWQREVVENTLRKSPDISKGHKHVRFPENPDDADYCSSPFVKVPQRCSSSSSSLSDTDVDDLGGLMNPGTESPPLHNLPGMHTHDIVYVSTRAPTTPSVFYTVRQACVQTLSCELLPTHTGPMFFGNPVIGYTIAYVFRLADPKARGGRRPYALLCICPDEQISIRSWNYVVRTFEGLVQRIKGFAALKNAKDKAAAVNKSGGGGGAGGSVGGIGGRFGGFTAPEGFLKIREGVGSEKDLAELVGKEDLFVEVHATFVRLLGGLGRKFGYWNGSSDAVLLKPERGEEGSGSGVMEKGRSRSVVRMGGGRDAKGLLSLESRRAVQRSRSSDGAVGGMT